MDFHADRKTFQKNYFDACRSYHLPVNNKANLLYHLALKYEDSKDADLFDLLMIAVADTGLYLSHFDYDTIDAEYEQKQFNKRYTKLLEHRKQLSLLSDQWSTIITKKDVANELSFDNEHSSSEEELIHLCYLYRKIFQVSEQESQELANNLTYYIPLIHHDADFESIAPLFLYQLMVCHTSRLATKKELYIDIKKLWKYREYNIVSDNSKNFRQYSSFCRLFRKLCRYYSSNENVSMELCRYGFCALSNLCEWLVEHKPNQIKRHLPALYYDLACSDLSCVETCEPEEYSPEAIFNVSLKSYQAYLSGYDATVCKVSSAVSAYLCENIEVLIEWMNHLYIDVTKLQSLTEQIFHECHFETLNKPAPINDCIKVQIYSTVLELIDRSVAYKMKEVLYLNTNTSV